MWIYIGWTSLLPGVGTIALAIISGAGGSALLELYYKPRRDKKRAASLLFAENILNAQLLLLQAEARKKRPRAIPEDYRLSMFAWEASQEVIKELPTDLLKKIVLLYNHYHDLNTNVKRYATLCRELDDVPADSERADDLRSELNVIIDVFNTGIDKVFATCKETLRELKKVGKIVEKEPEGESPPDYEARVEKLRQQRAVRLQFLEEMDEQRGREGTGPSDDA